MKCKGFIIGVIVGALSVGSIVVADNYYNIEPNPYKIFVNGEEKQIEGYNINDYSYFKLRDIGEQVGFTVDFKEDTIMIESKDKEALQNMEQNNERNDVIENEYPYVMIDGKEYIQCIDVVRMCDSFATRDFHWSLAYVGNLKNADLTGDEYVAYLYKTYEKKQIPSEEYKIVCDYIDDNGNAYFTRDTFENEILARIQG